MTPLRELVARVWEQIPEDAPCRNHLTDLDPNGIRTATNLHGIYGGDVASCPDRYLVKIVMI